MNNVASKGFVPIVSHTKDKRGKVDGKGKDFSRPDPG